MLIHSYFTIYRWTLTVTLSAVSILNAATFAWLNIYLAQINKEPTSTNHQYAKQLSLVGVNLMALLISAVIKQTIGYQLIPVKPCLYRQKKKKHKTLTTP